MNTRCAYWLNGKWQGSAREKKEDRAVWERMRKINKYDSDGDGDDDGGGGDNDGDHGIHHDDDKEEEDDDD